MDEMQLLRELGDRTPLATAAELAPVRARFVAATSRRPKRRFAVYGGAVIGLAAAIFAVFALIPPSEGGGGGPLAPPAASAQEFLQKAAAAAQGQPDVTPRPDQFIYHSYKQSYGPREEWLSADGAHDGLVRQDGEDTPLAGCVNGKAAVIKGTKPLPGEFEDCTPNPGYRPDLPTDADAMLAYLKKNQSGNKGDLNALSKDIMTMLMFDYLRPQSRAAVFQAVAKIEGLTMTEGVQDAAGRVGTEISWDYHTTKGDGTTTVPLHRSGAFIVDPKTYAFLGDKNSAQMAVAVVDKVGQRP